MRNLTDILNESLDLTSWERYLGDGGALLDYLKRQKAISSTYGYGDININDINGESVMTIDSVKRDKNGDAEPVISFHFPQGEQMGVDNLKFITFTSKQSLLSTVKKFHEWIQRYYTEKDGKFFK